MLPTAATSAKRTGATSLSCPSAEVESLQVRRYAPGKIFHLSGRLHFTCFKDDEATTAAINSNRWHYYFSNTAARVRRLLSTR